MCTRQKNSMVARRITTLLYKIPPTFLPPPHLLSPSLFMLASICIPYMQVCKHAWCCLNTVITMGHRSQLKIHCLFSIFHVFSFSNNFSSIFNSRNCIIAILTSSVNWIGNKYMNLEQTKKVTKTELHSHFVEICWKFLLFDFSGLTSQTRLGCVDVDVDGKTKRNSRIRIEFRLCVGECITLEC